MHTLHGARYILVQAEQMVGVLLLVYVAPRLASSVAHVATETVKTGFGGAAGNKGGVALRMEIDGASVCVINAHLPSGASHADDRNATVGEILRGLTSAFGAARDGPYPPPLGHDLCVFVGDLNYRLDERNEDVRAKLATSEWASLLAADQLNAARRNRLAFEGFDEAEVTFRPTYKFDVGTVDRYDTSEKARTPSWCDRVLWGRGPHVRCAAYVACHDVTCSDHKPVAARLVWAPPGADAAALAPPPPAAAATTSGSSLIDLHDDTPRMPSGTGDHPFLTGGVAAPAEMAPRGAPPHASSGSSGRSRSDLGRSRSDLSAGGSSPRLSADAQCVLRVSVLRGAGLKAQDLRGTSDPYVCVGLLGQQQRTRVISRTTEPTWNQTFEWRGTAAALLASPLSLEARRDRAEIAPRSLGDRNRGPQAWDADSFKRDDPLGEASVDLRAALLSTSATRGPDGGRTAAFLAPLSLQGTIELRAELSPANLLGELSGNSADESRALCGCAAGGWEEEVSMPDLYRPRLPSTLLIAAA